MMPYEAELMFTGAAQNKGPSILPRCRQWRSRNDERRDLTCAAQDKTSSLSLSR